MAKNSMDLLELLRQRGMDGDVSNKHADLFLAQSGAQRPVDTAR